MNDVKTPIKTMDYAAILADGNIPRSIREIKDKYKLSFPFSVVKIIDKTLTTPNAIKIGEVVHVPGFRHSRGIKKFMAVVGSEKPIRNGIQGMTSIDFPVYALWD